LLWLASYDLKLLLAPQKGNIFFLLIATQELLTLPRILQEILIHSMIQAPLNNHFNTTRTSRLQTPDVCEDSQACIILAENDHSKFYSKLI
jgi:hypothetical protein